MATTQQIAHCPVCGTRALVDPGTKKVRAHLRKGGVTCDGRVERPSRLARLVPPFIRNRRAARAARGDEADGVASVAPAAAPGAAADGPAGPERIRVDCPVCGRFCAVDTADVRIRLHRNRTEKKCPGSGVFPEVDTLMLDGITVAEVRQRRKDAMARRKPAGRPTGA